MKTYITIIFALVTTSTFSQTPSFEWGYGFGNIGYDKMIDFAIDSKGNVVGVGHFGKDINLDPSATVNKIVSNANYTFSNAFICKYDKSGKLLWAHSFGNNNTTEVTSVRLDKYDNIYISGHFKDTLDMDVTAGVNNLFPNNNANNEVYIAKYDKDCKIVWANSFGNKVANSLTKTRGIDLDKSGNIYICGTFSKSVDFNTNLLKDSTITALGTSDIYMAKYANDGKFKWVKQFGAAGKPQGDKAKIVIDNTNNAVYLASELWADIDLDPDAGTVLKTAGQAKSDFFMARYDTTGKYIWANVIGGTNNTHFVSFATDSIGSLYVTGFFNGKTDFNPGVEVDTLTSSFDTTNTKITYDIFMSKYTMNGDFVWVKVIGGPGTEERPSNITLTQSNLVYLSGKYKGNRLDFNTSSAIADTFYLTSNVKTDDAFYAKYNNNGEFVWANGIVGDNMDEGTMIKEVDNNTFYLSGITASNKVDLDFSKSDSSIFDRTKASAKSTDFFIAKYNYCNVNKAISVSGTTLTAQENNAIATYKWINADTKAVISGEVGKQLIAKSNGNYACVITINNCTITSDAINITGIGINEIEHNASFSIQPNPANQHISITLLASLAINKQVTIYDVLGKEVLRNKLTSTTIGANQLIDISALDSGVYYVTIDNSTRKIIKN